MVDYFKVTGDNPNPDFKGSMMIRDNGSTVSFHIRAGSVNTYRPDMPFGWTVNGSTGTSTKDYPTGKPWLFLVQFTVTTSQNVTFRLFETNTEGLGGPTTFTQWIERGTVPDKPRHMDSTDVSPTSVRFSFADPLDDGGNPILERRLRWGTNPSSPQNNTNYVPPNVTLTGLSPATTYYAWGQVRNAQGWSPLSNRLTHNTWGVIRIRVNGEWKTGTPYVKQAGVWKPGVPWVRSGGVWKEGS